MKEPERSKPKLKKTTNKQSKERKESKKRNMILVLITGK